MQNKTDITPLWDKHFGDTTFVSLSNESSKEFFQELNDICERDYEETKNAKEQNSEIKKYRTQND
jgi:hypothetical protein